MRARGSSHRCSSGDQGREHVSHGGGAAVNLLTLSHGGAADCLQELWSFMEAKDSFPLLHSLLRQVVVVKAPRRTANELTDQKLVLAFLNCDTSHHI